MNRLTSGLVLLLSLTPCVLSARATKPQCEICREIVENFGKGLEKTVKSNFGGGNTNWEEKSLGKWKTSETRLVEIVDHHICPDNDKKCHMFFENHEETLEDWYFNKYKDLDSSASLFDHWCVLSTKVCCSAGTFGKSCDLCPVGKNGQICTDHGKCDGDGTRSGAGRCICNSAYTGELCDECSDDYYPEKLDSVVSTCLPCHEACDEGCSGPGVKACESCASGWLWNEEGCQDVDECLDNSALCQMNQYCLNTPGSHSCNNCASACESCHGAGRESCIKCAEGYRLEAAEDDSKSCSDIDECAESPDICPVEGTTCVNKPGTFKCTCPNGQIISEGKCIDKPQKEMPPPPSPEAAPPGKTTANDKYPILRKYRTLDGMVLLSATSLYLILVLVFHAEAFKTFLVTISYAVFVYQYSGTYG